MIGPPILRKFNESTVLTIVVFTSAGDSLNGDAVFASGDVTISKDGSASTNTTNLPVDRGEFFELTLTSTETSASRVLVHLKDQSDPAVWLEDYIILETYGDANAQHGFNLGSVSPNVNVYSINNSTSAASNLQKSTDSMITFTVTSATGTNTSTNVYVTGIDEDDDNMFKDRALVFTSGNLIRQLKRINTYDGTNKMFNVEELTSAPSHGDTGIVV